jgi:hypothetical protein
METLLGSSYRVTMDVQWEAVFFMWSAPTLYHAIISSERDIGQLPLVTYSELQCLSAVVNEQSTSEIS